MAEIQPSDVYRVEIQKKTPNGNDITLKGSKVLPGKVLVICRMSIIDLSTVNRMLRLGYDRGGKLFWFRRKRAGAAGYGLSMETDLVLSGGERPIAMVEGPGTGDEIWFFAHGAYGTHF